MVNYVLSKCTPFYTHGNYYSTCLIPFILSLLLFFASIFLIVDSADSAHAENGGRQLCGLSYPSRNSNGTRMHSLQSVTRWLRGNLLKMLFTEAKQSRLTTSAVASANETTDCEVSALACERVRCSLHSVVEKIAFSSEK